MKIRSPLPHKKTRIEIIPLIDIMFFLLASFMVVSLQTQKVQTVRANLTTATMARSEAKPDMVNLSVDRYGRGSVDGEGAVTFPELYTTLTDRLAMNTNLPVYIAGSKQTSHGSMIYVLDFVRRAGVEKVAFAVKAKE